MPIKHLRAALRRYRPYFIVRVTGALTLCLTLALVLIMVTRAVYPAYGCITLTKHIQRSQDSSDDWLTDSSLYDPSSGRYFNSQLSKPAEYRDSFQRSLNDSYIAYTEYLTATDTTNLVVAKTDIGASVVLRQSIDDRDTPATHRLFLWSPGSRWIGYQVQTDSTHIQYKLAEVIPPYRIETIPQLLSVNGRFLGWSADEQYVAISDWDGITQTFTILAAADFHSGVTSSQPQPAIQSADNWLYTDAWDALWSPQGHTLAYQASDGTTSQLVLLSPDSQSGSQTERVEVPSGAIISDGERMFWSPKGTYIAVLSMSDRISSTNNHVDIFGIDGTAWRDIAKGAKNADCSGSCSALQLYWSADEQSLTYVDTAPNPQGSGADLITFWLTDSRHETIAAELYRDPQPLFDKHWLWVTPTSPPDLWGVTDAVLYSPDLHKKLVLITYGDLTARSESPDGKIALAWNMSMRASDSEWRPGGKGFVWTRLADGVLHTVEASAQSVTFLGWSADSQWFTYAVTPGADTGLTYLGIANVNTGENHRLMESLSTLFDGGPWKVAIPSADGKFIALVISDDSKKDTFQIFSTASEQSVPIEGLPSDYGATFWSPDSSQFAFTNFKADNDYWLMVYKTDGTLLNTRHLLTDNDSMRWTGCGVNG